jgi:phenylacetic acid degradation operon negative regulatory protein
VSHLVHLAGLFGINENRARVALSRMASAGEVTTDGSGRYRLAGHLLERRDRQAGSRRGETRDFDGSWHLVVVTASGQGADERATRRRSLGLARLAEQREGVWLRPDNIDLRPDPATDPDVSIYSATPEDDPRQLAATLWDLEGWARGAERLRDEMAALPPSDPGDLARGFVLSAAVLRHLQADPLLPATLLPETWPGTALRDEYQRWDVRYRQVLHTWGRAG